MSYHLKYSTHYTAEWGLLELDQYIVWLLILVYA